jgi:hypothetical protein
MEHAQRTEYQLLFVKTSIIRVLVRALEVYDKG